MINPTEQQLQRYWDRIQRALQVLQTVDRKSTEWGVVEYAIQILQEGQQ